jgi:hypothetical protein
MGVLGSLCGLASPALAERAPAPDPPPTRALPRRARPGARERAGPGRPFADPDATAFDPAAFNPIVVTGTSLAARAPVSLPSGSYQVRVFGLTATGRPLGRASAAVSLMVD